MSFNPALFRSLRGVVTSVTSHQNLSGDSLKTVEPCIGAACNDVSPLSPVSPPKNDEIEKSGAGDAGKESTAWAMEYLSTARHAHRSHMRTCPVCSISWAATAICGTHAELWQAYEVALVMVHGADKVLATDCQEDVEPVARARYPSPTATKSEAPETSQAISEPPAWTDTRDAYYSHIMKCTGCKPTGLCSEGQRLRGVFHSDFATSLQNSGA